MAALTRSGMLSSFPAKKVTLKPHLGFAVTLGPIIEVHPLVSAGVFQLVVTKRCESIQLAQGHEGPKSGVGGEVGRSVGADMRDAGGQSRAGRHIVWRPRSRLSE